MAKTKIRLYEKSNSKWLIAVSGVFAVLLLAVLVLAELPPSQTVVKQQESDTYTKWFFSRDECRYIFPAGSCVVDNKYCDLNTYDYQVMSLEPYERYCHKGTIVYSQQANAPRIVTNLTTQGRCAFRVNEGETVRLKPEGYDPDPDIGPAGRLIWTFYDPFDTNGIWVTKKGDAGIKNSRVKLSDGELTDEATFCVEVLKTNSAPVLAAIQDVTAREGESVTVRPRCTDPDGDKVTVTMTGFMTGETKQLGYNDAGRHEVTVTCTDPDGERDTEEFTVTVQDVNRPPTLDVPESVTVDEGKTARIVARTSDPDGDNVTVDFGTPFGDDGTWRTVRGDAGTYNVTVTASDGDKRVTKTVRVIVNKVNSAPVISGMQDITVYEGDRIELKPTIVDPDQDKVTVTYSGWMTSNVKQTGYDDAGEYDVTITARDPSGATATEPVHITVINRNRPPVITDLQ